VAVCRWRAARAFTTGHGKQILSAKAQSGLRSDLSQWMSEMSASIRTKHSDKIRRESENRQRHYEQQLQMKKRRRAAKKELKFAELSQETPRA
jgi:hypothetical protein